MRFFNAINTFARLGIIHRCWRAVVAVVAREEKVNLSLNSARGRRDQHSEIEARTQQRQWLFENHQIGGPANPILFASLMPPLFAAVGPEWWLELKSWGPFALLCGYLIWDLRTKDASRETRMSEQIASLETRLYEFQSGIGQQSVEALANNSTALASIRETMSICIAGMRQLEDSMEKLESQIRFQPCQLSRENLEKYMRSLGIENPEPGED